MKTWSIFRNGKEVSKELRASEAEGYKEVACWLLFVTKHFNSGGIIKDNNLEAFLKDAKDLGYYVGEIKDEQ